MYSFALPVMTIGEVKAAVKPFRFGLAASCLAWAATCCLTESSHCSAVNSVGSPNSGLRSAKGSSMEGSVLKNSTPAAKSLMVSPAGA